MLVRVTWCSESPSTGTQEENQRNKKLKLNPSDPELKTGSGFSELEHWLFRLVWLFHTHPSAFWAWTVICTRSDYVNTCMRWIMRPSEHLHARSNACFSILEVHTERVCSWENENVKTQMGTRDTVDRVWNRHSLLSASWVQTIANQCRPITGAGIFKSDGES